jgi:curved DNA-binding protein CbpA
MTDGMTHYDVLQIPENVSPELINKQWKKLSLKHHPDRDGDPTEMVKVNTAKDVLSDTNARMTYDRKLQRERQAREAAAMEAAAKEAEEAAARKRGAPPSCMRAVLCT